MDINEALRVLRTSVARLQTLPDEQATEQVAEAFSALDEWLSKGGFLPEEWQR